MTVPKRADDAQDALEAENARLREENARLHEMVDGLSRGQDLLAAALDARPPRRGNKKRGAKPKVEDRHGHAAVFKRLTELIKADPCQDRRTLARAKKTVAKEQGCTVKRIEQIIAPVMRRFGK